MSSSHSAATFTADQSHQGPPPFAPPSWVAVIGPSARTWARTCSHTCGDTSCQRIPRARNQRRRNA